MNGHEGGNIADGGEDLVACLKGNRQAVLACDLGDSAMIVVNGDDLESGGCLPEDGDIVRGDALGEADVEMVSPLLD